MRIVAAIFVVALERCTNDYAVGSVRNRYLHTREFRRIRAKKTRFIAACSCSRIVGKIAENLRTELGRRLAFPLVKLECKIVLCCAHHTEFITADERRVVGDDRDRSIARKIIRLAIYHFCGDYERIVRHEKPLIPIGKAVVCYRLHDTCGIFDLFNSARDARHVVVLHPAPAVAGELNESRGIRILQVLRTYPHHFAVVPRFPSVGLMPLVSRPLSRGRRVNPLYPVRVGILHGRPLGEVLV